MLLALLLPAPPIERVSLFQRRHQSLDGARFRARGCSICCWRSITNVSTIEEGGDSTNDRIGGGEKEIRTLIATRASRHRVEWGTASRKSRTRWG